MNDKSLMVRIGIVLTIMIGFYLQAQQHRYWPYDRLRSQADIVVIGEVTKTEDSGELIPSPLFQADFVGVNTTIRVNGVMKGRFRSAEVTLFHLRMPDGKTMKDKPFNAVFKASRPVPRTSTPRSDVARDEYLFFLRKRKDGRFEPVSGLLDSGYSVRELRLPEVAQ